MSVVNFLNKVENFIGKTIAGEDFFVGSLFLILCITAVCFLIAEIKNKNPQKK